MRKLIFITVGEDVCVIVDDTDTLAYARHVALTTSHNTMLPESRWEIRDERGIWLDPETLCGDFENNTRMFLTLKVGAGGIEEALEKLNGNG